MTDSTIDPILVRGEHAALRIWRDEDRSADKPEVTRSYETLGYVISGAVDLTVNGHTVSLRAGDSYIVPKDAPHRYVVQERLTAVEAIAPNV